MHRQFIHVCSALGVVGFAGAAMAGDTTRVDLSFTAVDIIPFFFSGAQTVEADAGRYFDSYGWSSVDVDVCWNVGEVQSYVAGEIEFAQSFSINGADEGGYFVGSPFDGDTTGAASEGTCVNVFAGPEAGFVYNPYTISIGADGTTLVGLAAFADYDAAGAGTFAGTCNSANYFFVLAAPIPAVCVDATGSCGEVHPTPGCADAGCCAKTCDVNNGGDSYCCDFDWDVNCVNLAFALCDLFQYSCVAPAYANDCVTSPTTLANGGSAAFDTTLANFDGPVMSCAAGGGPDVWYLVEIDAVGGAASQLLTVSTCDAADFDTALGLYDAGPIGSSFDPATLPSVEVGCNDDGNCTGFTSELNAVVTAGNQYLVRVTGWFDATNGVYEVGTGTVSVGWTPLIAPQTCDAPGPDAFTQNTTDVLTTDGVACAGGGITTENAYCRVYSADQVGEAFTIDCVQFGVFNGGSYLEGRINILTSATGSPSPYANLTLVGSRDFGFYSTPDLEYFTVSFEDEGGLDVDLSGGASLVIEMEYPASSDGFVTFAGGTAADVDAGTTTYLRSNSCGIAEYVAVGAVGPFDLEWFVDVSGTAGGSTPCPADFNGDGIVNGADFGSILAKWGPCAGCAEDLNGDGQVSGADVGLLLSSWGACP